MTSQVHNQLRRGFLSSALTRAVGDTRGEGGLERFGETLTPTIDLWDRPEWNYLRKDFLLSCFRTSAAVAGEMSGLALCNPTGSNSIAVMERIACWGPAVGNAIYVNRAVNSIWQATYATAGGRGVSRDARIAYNVSPGFCDIIIGSDPGALGTAIGVTAVGNANGMTECMGPPYVITPGEGLGIYCNTVNTVLYVCMLWRERACLPGELE